MPANKTSSLAKTKTPSTVWPGVAIIFIKILRRFAHEDYPLVAVAGTHLFNCKIIKAGQHLEAMKFFVGNWKGTGEGERGISEAIENISPGWRAKETYQLINADQFIETFELAPPNGEFEVYTKTTLNRIK